MEILRMENITKKFNQKVIANENVNFSVEKGEVHALLGENGAGKSTLMNILCGIYGATSGTVYYHSEKLRLKSAAEAQKKGIGMVHQHFMLIPNMTVIENVILGMENKSILDMGAAAEKFLKLSEKYGMKINPYEKVANLSVGQQQRMEILKVLYKGSDLIILDEPTAILTPEEVESLYAIIHTLIEEGRTVIFITHKMKEVMDICDRCTVLRNGKSVKSLAIPEIESVEELARLMVGREVELHLKKKECHPGKKVLRVINLECRDEKGTLLLEKINFSVRAGEIVGVAGVDGNGQSELVSCITALRRTSGGAVEISGENVTNSSVKNVLEQGTAHIPEDRQRFGLIGDMTLAENLILMSAKKQPYSRHGILNRKWIRKHSCQMLQEFDVKAPDIDVPAGHLSGGNQQKLVIGRELERKPQLLIAMHPDRGLDIGATKYIQSRLLKERDRGAAVLMISTELDEIMELSDRIIVMFEGRIAGILDAATATREQVGLLMAGGS